MHNFSYTMVKMSNKMVKICMSLLWMIQTFSSSENQAVEKGYSLFFPLPDHKN